MVSWFCHSLAQDSVLCLEQSMSQDRVLRQQVSVKCANLEIRTTMVVAFIP